jgi:hypothetical protein
MQSYRSMSNDFYGMWLEAPCPIISDSFRSAIADTPADAGLSSLKGYRLGASDGLMSRGFNWRRPAMIRPRPASVIAHVARLVDRQ